MIVFLFWLVLWSLWSFLWYGLLSQLSVLREARMAPHFSNIFLFKILFSKFFLAVSAVEKIDCNSTQICLPKNDCPAMVQLWNDIKQDLSGALSLVQIHPDTGL